MANVIRGLLIGCVVLLVGVMPVVWYRAFYVHGKRLPGGRPRATLLPQRRNDC